MKTLKTFAALSSELRTIANSTLPLAYQVICEEFGEEAKKDAKEELIGRIAPFQGVTLPETGDRFPAWAPHAPMTIDLKSLSGGGKGGDPETYLYDTGEMYNSIDYTVTGARIVTLGSDSDHAVDTEYGDPLRNVPARPFLGPAIIRTATKLKPRMGMIIARALCGGSP